MPAGKKLTIGSLLCVPRSPDSVSDGTVAERTNAPALKAGGSQGPGVRIPPVPPFLAVVVKATSLLLVMLLAVSCSGDATPEETVVVVTAELPAEQVLPKAEELFAVIPLAEDLEGFSFGVAGDYELLSEDVIEQPLVAVPWAAGSQIGVEHQFEMKVIKESNPMATHQSFATIRILLFDTKKNAYRASLAFIGGQSDGAATEIFNDDETGVHFSSVVVADVTDKGWISSEGIAQKGRSLVWVRIKHVEDAPNLETLSMNLSGVLIGALDDQFPSLNTDG